MAGKQDPEQVFEAARPLLTGLAYRILGSYAEAEDVVQETFLSWMAKAPEEIEKPRSWLMAVCSRKAVDALRAARRARTTYVGAWLPEPIHTVLLETPESEAELSQSITMAFLLVLERLAPKERAAFLLHEVFAMDYRQVAESLGVSEAACRKLVSRARSNVQRGEALQEVPRERQAELLAAFSAAVRTGATESLVRLLSAEVTLRADSGGKAVAIRHDLQGAGAVSGFVGRVLSPDWQDAVLEATELNARLALVVRVGGKAVAVVSFAYADDGRATAVFITRNPDKLLQLDRPGLAV